MLPAMWSLGEGLGEPMPLVPSTSDSGYLPGPPVPRWTLWLCLCWPLPFALYYLLDLLTQQRRRVFRGAAATAVSPQETIRTEDGTAPAASELALPAAGSRVLVASIEHSLPQRSVKVIAGGLGKVMDLVARHHPTELTMVHPMVGGEGPGLDGPAYGHPDSEEPPLQLTVDGRQEEVRVWAFRGAAPGPGLPPVEFLLLEHELFTRRSKRCIYPNPMSRVDVLAFFSLWNQAVGMLLARRRPHVFHCPDFHTALAPWYARPLHPDLRVLLVLHNAEYQGSISTDQIRGDKVDRMAKIFNLSPEQVRDHLILDGRFNMLKAAVDFLLEHQQGLGACAVSDYYAQEVRQLYGLLWRLPEVGGLENPMLEDERVEYGDSLQARRAAAKAAIQRELGLDENPDAKVFVSLGRLVRQKGVDLLADVAEWLLEKHQEAQLIIVGPVADGFGHYASHHLQGLAQDVRFRGRVFVKCEFWKVSDDLRFAADFCLMPSRDEPFGYVDVEFAWCGALVVGAQAGGLGKVPGFYYVAQNRENLSRLRRELKRALTLAMAATREELQAMSEAAVQCTFPLEAWQRRICELYEQVLRTRETDPALQLNVELGGPPAAEQALDAEAQAAPRQTVVAAVPSPKTGGGSPVTMSFTAPQDAGGGVTPFGAASAAATPGGPGRDAEFLTQELSEEELQAHMACKMDPATGTHHIGIDRILEAVGCDVDESRETSSLSRWLLRPLLGTQRIHWVVACGYVMSPLGEVFSFTMASEWGLRAQGSWLPGFLPDRVHQALGGPMDPSLLHIVLFCCNALGLSVSSVCWARACQRIQPRWALAGALLAQLLLLVGLLPVTPNFYGAAALMFLHGAVAGASMLFVVFNFMMSIKADLSQAALRMGRMETVRYCVSWLATGYVYVASPDSVPGTKENPLAAEVILLAAPLAFFVALSASVAGVLCIFAPRPYREDRFPSWDLALFWHKRSFVLLAFSECIGSLVAFPALSYASWWLANGWRDDQLAAVSAVLAVVLAVGVMLWAQVLSSASVHGFSLLISVAVFLLPPSLLAAVCQQEVSSFDYRGRSMAAMIVCAVTLLLQGMQSSAIWAAKIRVLGSRWRLLSYGTVLLSASQFCTFLSPILCEYIARHFSVSFLTRNQEELAIAVTACVVPLGILQYLAQIAAAPFIHGDMGSARHRLQPPASGAPECCGNLRRPRTFAARRPIILAAFIGVALLGWVATIEYGWILEPLPFSPVRRCRHLPEGWDRLGCTELARLRRDDFGLNDFGQNTTAKMNCLREMRHEGGDTFELRDVSQGDGECRVLKCAGKDNMKRVKAEPPQGDVYSRHCSIFGQNLVMVHLFEWRWADIALECEQYLGPAGFDAVQVSPPAEHVTGSPWFTRYQPVSYKLDSRSGSATEFADMVRRCRQAGVSIMVDAVINHMASKVLVWPESNDTNKPFECNNSFEPESNLTCVGWSGTTYGDRQFWDGGASYDREAFHHFNGHPRSNCALPPWTNNRHLCDLQGLPDLDTENRTVQDKLVRFLTDLYDVGVTMLRVDAAMLMYPASLADMLERVPFDYIVQEYYPDVLAVETRTLKDATTISALTNFKYGWTLARILFDYWDPGTEAWLSRESEFGQLLKLNSKETEYPDTPLPVTKGLQFLDNHDQQRERWKVCQNEGDPACADLNITCNDPGDGQCRPIYKHGAIYQLATIFSLAWPFGDSFRMMSSFAWTYFRQGPPGTRRNESGDVPTPVWADGDKKQPSGCRSRPTTSPVDAAYDNDTKHPWVCEHRWEGVPGLVRLRKLLGSVCGGNWSGCRVTNPFSHLGFAHFSVAAVAGDTPLSFVAMSRGYNWFTQSGYERIWDLAQESHPVNSTLPEGEYCNLASVLHPVPHASAPTWPNCSDVVRVGPGGAIAQGVVRNGSAVVIHRLYWRPLQRPHSDDQPPAEVESAQPLLY